MKLLVFRIFLKTIKDNGRVIVLDIDNTLANTWPELLKSDPVDFQKIPVLMGSKKYLEDNYPNHRRIFLTARPLSSFKVTYRWLKLNNFWKKGSFLATVSKVEEKVSYLHNLLNCNFEIIYIDDLSFNHENGEVLFYDAVIDEIKLLPLVYYDYGFISKINIR